MGQSMFHHQTERRGYSFINSLQFEKELGFRPMVNLNGTPAEQRKVLEDGCALRDGKSLKRELIDRVTTKDETITTTDGETKIPIRIYNALPKSDKPAPAAVYFHGGGWILGSIAADDRFCRKLAHDLKHVVISVEYRLGENSKSGF